MLLRTGATSATRRFLRAASSFARPGPPPLPQKDQREFEQLQKVAETNPVHPDAPKPLQDAFVGDVNPTTGEQGGPKHEPVKQWAEGDWSFKGRVSDF